ncbi:MAG TPA: hypothetical protein VML75_29045 [Kofleriaceae bacterium]|nr:hypothetical protein [Kofleriaceae bacterium]
MGGRIRAKITMALVVLACEFAWAGRVQADTVAPSAGQTASEKSPWVATGLAVGVTLGGLGIGALAGCLDPDLSSPSSWAGLGIAYASMAAGPSAGHWYAGETRHVLRWTAIRTAGLAAMVGGFLLVDKYDSGAPLSSGLALAILGGGTYAVGLYWDFFDAHRAAKRANQRTTTTLTIAPMVTRGIGLQLAGSF